MVFCEKKYQSIRNKLDAMGYQQPLSVESMLLVENILTDLIRSQETIHHYKSVAKNATEKCEELSQTMGPYKEKNEKLMKENNELRYRLIYEEEQMKKNIIELRHYIIDLEQCKSDLEFLNNEHLTRIGEQEKQLCQKEKKLLELEGNNCSNRTGKTTKINKSEGSKNWKRGKLQEIRSTPSQFPHTKYQSIQVGNQYETKHDNRQHFKSAHKNPSEFEGELRTLRKENSQMLEEIEFQNDQIVMRDAEIKRLGNELEKKIPVSLSQQKHCICHHSEEQKLLKEMNRELEIKLRDAKHKQHEAMLRAICLADQIQELESKVAYKSQPEAGDNDEVQNVKDKLNSCLLKIEQLEDALVELDKTNERLSSDKEKLERQLTSATLKKVERSSPELENKSQKVSQSGDLQRQGFNKCNCSTKLEEKIQNQVQEIASIQAEHCRKFHPPEELNSLNSTVEDLKKKLIQKEEEVNSLQKRMQELEKFHSRNPFRKDEGEARNSEENKFAQMRLHLDEQLHRLNVEKNDLSLKVSVLTSETRSFKEHNEMLRDQINTFSIEKVQLTSSNSHLKLMLEQAERSLQNCQASVHIVEAELASAIERIQEMETEKNQLEADLSCVKSERCMLRGNITQLDHEKDNLLMKLDEKTEQLAQIKKDLREKTSNLTELENINAKLQNRIIKLEDFNVRNEQSSRCVADEVDHLKKQISSLLHSKDLFMNENRRLQDELAVVTQDYIHSNCALESCKKEVEDLKTQLLGYVTEVKHVEDLLQQKESERTNLLDHFRSLSLEATALETNNHSLENEAKSTKSSLKTVQDRLLDLEVFVRDKDALVLSMENQIAELSQQVASFEIKVIELSTDKKQLENDLANSQTLSSALENQKQRLNGQLHELHVSNNKLQEEISRLQCQHEHLEVQFHNERKNSTTLENVLTSSRHESIETSISNQDLKRQIQDLKDTVHKLENHM